MNPTTSRFATLMGSASFLTITAAMSAHAQQVAQAQMAQAAPEAIPEQVLITGSLIHGTAAVGVPVTNLGAQDFTQTGAVTIGDLFRTVPQANVAPGPAAVNSGGHQERETRVNIRGLDQTGPRTLLMVDGVRFPPQADGLCAIDPSVIPALALDRIDILADGASATYGSDAIAGVINVILKRNFDGAVTLFHYQMPDKGGQELQASQLWGRTWEGGDITLTYEYIDDKPVLGTAHSNYTVNYTPWGLDNSIPLTASMPGTITTGAPKFFNTPPGSNGQPAAFGTTCSNCFAVPKGGGTAFNPALNGGVGPLNPSQAGAAFSSYAAGVNEIDPLKQGYEFAAQQSNRWVGTFDQRLFPGVSVFAEGFGSNRRVSNLLTPDYSSGANNEIRTLAVPTTNPYYPIGAPNNLRVSYDFATEMPIRQPSFEISYRYAGGFNLDLPFGWSGNLYYSQSHEANQYQLYPPDVATMSAALGWTIADANVPSSGGTFAKPATVPYLNLFCDPTALQCNSPKTIAYIRAQRTLGDIYRISERGARFDGPVFDLPAGQVKAAVGGLYESDNVFVYAGNNTGANPGTPLAFLNDSEPYNVWAGFAQVDIPIFGDNLNIPLVRKFDLEGSWRYDSYSGTLSGTTRNPKVAFTWLVDDVAGLTVRGSWGTSFRFANAGEYSTVASDANADFNFNGQPSPVHVTCPGGAPIAGSASAVLLATGTWGCNSTPGGITWAGGPHPELRFYTDPTTGQVTSRENGISLAPERANNYSLGFEFAPQFAFLRGLDVQATWYSVKINGTLLGFNATNDNTLGQPSDRFHIIFPSDLGCPVAQNATPMACAPFKAMATAALSDRNSPSDLSFLTNVFWIDDGSTVGTGFTRVTGIDFNASYDLDLGDLGAWNAGVTGTYYLHRYTQTVPGTPITDDYHTNAAAAGGIPQNGVTSRPPKNIRARLGWSDGPLSATVFWNHIDHYYDSSPIPPNVNFQCTAAGGNVTGGTFPCAISNYSSVEPAWDSVDLSFGYNTGDMPVNDYLKRIQIQLSVQNVTGKHAAFEYNNSTSARNISAYDRLKQNFGRILGITLVKTW